MTTRSMTVKRRLAGDDHAVVTVVGSGHRYRRRPCEDCPWRTDAVGKFPAEAFRLSASTGAESLEVSPEDLGPSGRVTSLNERFSEVTHTFGCHSSGLEMSATCAGYILRGDAALGWRMAAVRGWFDRDRVTDAGIALFDSYYAMAVANGVLPDDPTLSACRPWRPEDRRR